MCRLINNIRVENGLWLNSHTALCAEIYGMPLQVVRRARYVRYVLQVGLDILHIQDPNRTSHLLSIHEWGKLLDEEMNEQEHQELAEAEEVCRRFLAWNLEEQSRGRGYRNIKEGLTAVLGRDIS